MDLGTPNILEFKSLSPQRKTKVTKVLSEQPMLFVKKNHSGYLVSVQGNDDDLPLLRSLTEVPPLQRSPSPFEELRIKSPTRLPKPKGTRELRPLGWCIKTIEKIYQERFNLFEIELNSIDFDSDDENRGNIDFKQFVISFVSNTFGSNRAQQMLNNLIFSCNKYLNRENGVEDFIKKYLCYFLDFYNDELDIYVLMWFTKARSAILRYCETDKKHNYVLRKVNLKRAIRVAFGSDVQQSVNFFEVYSNLLFPNNENTILFLYFLMEIFEYYLQAQQIIANETNEFSDENIEEYQASNTFINDFPYHTQDNEAFEEMTFEKTIPTEKNSQIEKSVHLVIDSQDSQNIFDNEPLYGNYSYEDFSTIVNTTFSLSKTENETTDEDMEENSVIPKLQTNDMTNLHSHTSTVSATSLLDIASMNLEDVDNHVFLESSLTNNRELIDSMANLKDEFANDSDEQNIDSDNDYFDDELYHENVENSDNFVGIENTIGMIDKMKQLGKIK
eukprot:TRINITY_DN2869_c0_g2_i1.p1 TRINITY_DN2869_c0_g2~~TRINITY_DN2869_c0_g2_i1.p1  ORF type:complete len:513 (+),score=128.54 TRINITY_DN2869_c0_g2_i1:34-1539(+)